MSIYLNTDKFSYCKTDSTNSKKNTSSTNSISSAKSSQTIFSTDKTQSSKIDKAKLEKTNQLKKTMIKTMMACKKQIGKAIKYFDAQSQLKFNSFAEDYFKTKVGNLDSEMENIDNSTLDMTENINVDNLEANVNSLCAKYNKTAQAADSTKEMSKQLLDLYNKVPADKKDAVNNLINEKNFKETLDKFINSKNTASTNGIDQKSNGQESNENLLEKNGKSAEMTKMFKSINKMLEKLNKGKDTKDEDIQGKSSEDFDLSNIMDKNSLKALTNNGQNISNNQTNPFGNNNSQNQNLFSFLPKKKFNN